jgi:hypothetical protein
MRKPIVQLLRFIIIQVTVSLFVVVLLSMQLGGAGLTPLYRSMALKAKKVLLSNTHGPV